MKHIWLTVVLIITLIISVNVPNYVNISFIHLLVGSMLLHAVGYGFYLAYGYAKGVLKELEDHNQKVIAQYESHIISLRQHLKASDDDRTK